MVLKGVIMVLIDIAVTLMSECDKCFINKESDVRADRADSGARQELRGERAFKEGDGGF